MLKFKYYLYFTGMSVETYPVISHCIWLRGCGNSFPKTRLNNYLNNLNIQSEGPGYEVGSERPLLETSNLFESFR